jgi:hypothetical protein
MGTWRHLAAKVGTSKGRGKQWQTTPKNLPRMQRATAIPIAWLGSGSCQNWLKGWILMMMICIEGYSVEKSCVSPLWVSLGNSKLFLGMVGVIKKLLLSSSSSAVAVAVAWLWWLRIFYSLPNQAKLTLVYWLGTNVPRHGAVLNCSWWCRLTILPVFLYVLWSLLDTKLSLCSGYILYSLQCFLNCNWTILYHVSKKSLIYMLCHNLLHRSSNTVMGKLRPMGQTRPPERFYLACNMNPNLMNEKKKN